MITMKRFVLGLFFITALAFAGGELYAPNLGKNVTGTTVSTKNGLDVNIIGGAAGSGVSGTTWVNGDGGSSALAVRKDSEGALTGIDNGENTPMQVDSAGRLKITQVSLAGNGSAIPAQTNVVSGYDGSLVRAIKTDSGGAVQVDVESSALPTGAATESTLSTLNGKVTAVNTGAVVISSSALPTGAATESTLSTLNGKVTAVNTGAVVISSSALPSGASTSALQTTGNSSLSSIDGKITAVNTGAVVVSSSALPSGAATSAKQDTGNTSLSSIDGKITAVNTGAVTISAALPTGTNSIGRVSLQDGSANAITSSALGSLRGIHTRPIGRTAADKARNDYTSVNVTTSAYVTLDASLAAEAHEVEIFDSSGQTLVLATGAAASEVDQVYILPGGNGRIPLRIAAGTRTSIKAVSGTASAGEIDVNFYGE